MATITLIRHGQASFGSENYDELSDLGQEQASQLGKRFKQQGAEFDFVLLGSMHRHRQTAETCLTELGSSLDATQNELNPGWNEYDHQNILAQFNPELASAQSTKAWVAQQQNPLLAFEAAFNGAVHQWMDASQNDIGTPQFDYTESWSVYKQRIHDAFQQAIALGREHRNIAVFTSGGPISLLSQFLLGVPERNLMSLNWTLVNCGVTKVVSASSRQFIASLNDHAHFEGAQTNLITYK